jgi:hypothetical protein
MNKALLVVALFVVLSGGAAAVSFALAETSVQTYAIDGTVREIVVTSESGDVRLTAGGPRVEIRETQRYVSQRPKLGRELRDGVLRIDSHCDRFVLRCSADLRVSVPAGVAVSVDADSGDVHADEVDVRGAHLRSDSGDIDLELLGSQSLVWAHTDSGRVAVSAPDADAIDAQSDSGDIRVDAAGDVARVVAHTDSGDVSVSVPAGRYAVDAATDSGDVEVEGVSRDDGAPRTIQARTDSGDVAVRAR